MIEQRTDINHKTVKSFLRANRLLKAAASRCAESFGLHRSQHRMLMLICRNGGGVSQKQLAEAMDVSPAAITVMLNKLQESGYITRVSSKTDSRVNLISPTEKALEIQTASQQYFEELDSTLLKGFEEQELLVLINAFERMQKNFSKTDTEE